jgi:signal transduction histidine kinase
MITAAQTPAGTRAGPAPAPPTYVLVAIALAGCVLAGMSIALAIREGVPDIQIALLEWISIPYIAAGLIAWWRRPESRLGVLMILGGFATGLLALQFTDVEALKTIGSLLDIVPVALFLHVSLAFPSGRLRSDFERGLVVAAYAMAIGLQVAKVMLGAFGPDNLLAISSHPDGALVVERVQLLSMSALCLTAVGLLVARRRDAGRPRRPWLALLVDSFALGLVMVAVLYIDGALDGPAFVPFQRATLAVIGISPIVFLLGLLDARLARSGVGDLVIRLRGNPSPDELAGALSRALRDPSLELVYWLPEFGCYADLDGREVALPGPDDRRATTPIDHDGSRVAALIHDPSLADERELLAAVTAAAGIALENARLQVELRARLEELRGSRARIVEVAQEERKRLERNLHDGAQQRLVALSLELGLLGEQLDAAEPARARLEQARGEIAESLAELREIARGLHPAVVSAHGLEVALEQLVALSPVPVALVVRVDGRLPEPVEVAAYYLVCESLANVGKYAKASSARVEVLRQGDLVRVEVADDGVGGAHTEGGSGLRGLADRVEALDGRLRVWSPSGGGTRVSAEIPCAS